ncbi:MAG: DUF3841 domain-containing protein [Desulfovibrio sp.]|jgi:hypothetical protein|nr:DUF3841 domain-containing protein [Desulfovibrio sp.]
MKLHHFCNKAAYEYLQREGYLNGDGRRADRLLRDLDSRPYHWIAEQMQRRLPPRHPRAAAFPVWAWHTHNGKRGTDLRNCGLGHKGGLTVRLTIKISDEFVLLSDHADWHSVLNNWFITDSEAESDMWDERKKTWPKEQFTTAMRRSWEKIFDLNRKVDPAWRGSLPSPYIQACFWVLEADMVIKERWFTAR